MRPALRRLRVVRPRARLLHRRAGRPADADPSGMPTPAINAAQKGASTTETARLPRPVLRDGSCLPRLPGAGGRR